MGVVFACFFVLQLNNHRRRLPGCNGCGCTQRNGPVAAPNPEELAATKTVIDNYSSLLQCFQELLESDRSEAGAKVNGLLGQSVHFDNYFLLCLMYKVLSHAETVSTSIQKNNLDLFQTQLKLNQLKADVAGLRSDIEFDEFWSEVTNNSHLLDVDEPKANIQQSSIASY